MTYTTHSLEEYNEVMKLRKLGLGATKISSSLLDRGIIIKENTVGGWIYEDKKPFEEKIINKISKKSKILNKIIIISVKKYLNTSFN